MQALFSTWRGRPVSGLCENLEVDTVAVFQRNLVFESGRNQDVTRNAPYRTRPGECFGIGKILYRSRFFPEIVQFLNRNSVQVEHRGIPLGNGDDLAPIFLRQKFRSIIADVSETLDHDSLAFQTRRELQSFQIFGMLKCLSNAELNAAARGLATSMNAALRDGLSGNAGKIVDTARIEGVVRVRHPCHFAFAGSHIWSGNIFTRTDITLADQFSGKPSSNFLDLLLGVFLRIEANAAF